MAVSAEQFGKALVASGLFTADDVKALWSSLDAAERTAEAGKFSERLVAQGKLTPFQAEELLAGRGRRLVLGEYTLLSAIGEGGMGQVFKAMHRRMERIVALKVMSQAAMRDPGNVKRFQREVEAAARLTHENIVAAYDAGQAGETHFLVMQFVDGCDLATIVKRDGPLPIETAVNYVIQAAQGLAYAHSEGIVHRDIKPANLLVNSKGVVKILDMGLARLDDGGDGLTATEQVMGTVDYMSPEQASHTKDADARSDIYSLGCTLWYLLTARKLYDGATMISRLMQHRNDPLPSLVKTRDDASWPLEQALHKMIAKRPSDRLQTMTDVIAALRPFAPATLKAGVRDGSKSFAPNAEMASFLRTLDTAPGRSSASVTKPATSTEIGATVTFHRAEVDTDSRVAPSAGPSVAGKSSPSLPKLPAGKTKARGNTKLFVGVGLGVVLVAAALALTAGKNDDAAELAASPSATTASVRPQNAAPAPPQITPYELLTSDRFCWSAPVNLGPSINSPTREHTPFLTADGLTMLLASNRAAGNYDLDLWSSTRVSPTSPWPDAAPVGDRINTTELEEHPELSADGLSLYFSRGAFNGPTDIFVATRASTSSPWSDPVPLPEPINTPDREGGCELSPDGLTLYFHSNRPGSLGHRDLYMSRRKSTTDSFSEVTSLGPMVNSTFDEEHPTVSADGRVLIFASSRPAAARGWKLYMSTRPNADSEWTAPEMLPWPVTGSVDENNPQFAAGGTILMFRSRRPGAGEEDLFATVRKPNDGSGLPLDAQSHGDHRYRFMQGTFTWDEAAAAAAREGGHLAVIDDVAEDVWFKKTYIEKLPQGMLIWIGLMRRSIGAEWEWIDGSPSTYRNWSPSEGLLEHEQAAAFIHGDNGLIAWVDYSRDKMPFGISGSYRGFNRCAGYVVEWDSLAIPPEADRALTFATRWSGLRVPNWDYDGKSSLTIEAWVRLDQDSESLSFVVAGDPQDGGVTLGCIRNELGFRMLRPGGGTAAKSTTRLEVGRVTHLAGVFDGAGLRLYVDGKLQGRAPFQDAFAKSRGKFLIGADPDDKGNFSLPFPGAIDEVRISTTARYDADFTPARRFEPDAETWALYHFDDGVGLTVRDSSSAGRHAALQGGEWIPGLAVENLPSEQGK